MTDPTGTSGPLDEDAPRAGDEPLDDELAPVRFPSVRRHDTEPSATVSGLDDAAGDDATLPSSTTAASPGGEPAPATGATSSTDESADETDDGTHDEAATGWWTRLPWWAWAVAAVVVVAAVVAIVLATRGGGSSGPVTAPAVTVTAPAPTPTAAPLDHSEGSDLFTGLPGASGQFVLVAAAEDPAWVDDGDAIESYALTYSGPSTASATSASPVTVSYHVVVGQWKKPEDVTAFAGSLATATTPDPTSTVTTPDVTAGGATVGTATITVPADTTADGTAVWTNGTVVVQVTGPGADLRRFFDGFGW